MKTNPNIIRAKDYMQPGSTVLDLGAGEGNNGAYLAENGFDVTFVDKDISKVKRNYPEAKAIEIDLMNFEFPEAGVDNIICNFVLHFQGKENASLLLSRIQAATHIGGINQISDFVGPVPGNLKDLYVGWEIIHYEESTTIMYDGKWNTAMQLIAKKL